MTTINRQTTINAPKQKVWEALADFGNVVKLNPNIAISRCTSEAKNGVGATRHCKFVAMGSEIDEKITAWKEGESMTINIFGFKNMPKMNNVNVYFTVEAKGDKTLLKSSFEYEMASVIGRVMNKLLIKGANKKAWGDFIAGIKHNIETGERVNQKTNLKVYKDLITEY